MKKTVMGVPAACFRAVIAVCLLGIAVGSFCDLAVSQALARKTEIGTFFATYYKLVPDFFFAAAGACLFVALRGRGRAPAWTMLVAVLYYAVYKAENSFGGVIRDFLGYEAGSSSILLYLLSWLFWAALFSLEAFILIRLLDGSDPGKLIAVAVTILLASVTASNLNSWLKLFGARPRFKYLLKLEDPMSQYRNWWQVIPHLSGSDNYKSWPSGHMTTFSIVFTLPMLTDVMKRRSMKKNLFAFGISCVLMLICAYNRIHMTNHFLSDVCFGCMNSYLVYAAISTALMKAAAPPPAAQQDPPDA